jgi:hypothetical protein
MPPAGPDPRSEFLVRADLERVEPSVADLIRWEAELQARNLILIPSESTALQGHPAGTRLRVPEHQCRGIPPAAHDARS